MDFWKMNGAGNDFLILDDRLLKIPDKRLGGIAKTLCDRHMSIGADGLMVVRPAKKGGDYRMLFYNADGSAAEMCGNGARCICRYGFENHLAGERQVVETPSGRVYGERVSIRDYRVRLTPPTSFRMIDARLDDGIERLCAYVELGEPGLPHAAVPYKGLRGADENELRVLSRKLRYYHEFPKGANVNFYESIGEDHVFIRTYERGVEDFTYACGTGTASVALAMFREGKLKSDTLRADMRGGTLYVTARDEAGMTQLYLTGPTNIVCKGEITDEELHLG